jgi:cytochrome c oxidase subunit 2
MGIALVLAALALGSVLFHVLSPWWWTPIASNWHNIDATIVATFWITGVAFTLLVLFMAYCVYRFEHKRGLNADYEPENRKLESWLAFGTTIGVIAMLAPGLIVWNEFVTTPVQASVIEVVGQQWQWSFRLPGKDGKLGSADTRFVADKNDLGINPADANGADDVVLTGADLHLPVGRPVKVLLRSLDVVHDFYVPQFRAKMDLMPGTVTYFWFTPTKEGTYEILCAGFCGVGHPQMRGSIVIDSQVAYDTWLSGQKTFAELSAIRAASADAPKPSSAEKSN